MEKTPKDLLREFAPEFAKHQIEPYFLKTKNIWPS